MAKSIEEKAKDKNPLVRCSVASDEKAPLKLLEMLASDSDPAVRGDLSTNISASEDILRKLSIDSDESVRCGVASNSSTPLDVLKVLSTDKSKYVKFNATANPNFKKIPKSTSSGGKQQKDEKKSAGKSKSINGEFSTRELTASLFTYSISQFKKIKLKAELKKWADDLDSNSSSYPVYVGSPFDQKNLNLETTCEDEEFSEDAIYVVPHYFYKTADYIFDGKIDSNGSIVLAPVLGIIMECKPMDCVVMDGEQIWFEGQGASDGTDYQVSFFKGSKLLKTLKLNMLSEADLKSLQDKV